MYDSRIQFPVVLMKKAAIKGVHGLVPENIRFHPFK